MTAGVIVGTGFAGFECARRLARRLRRANSSGVDVTIVSPIDYMLYTPLLALDRLARQRRFPVLG